MNFSNTSCRIRRISGLNCPLGHQLSNDYAVCILFCPIFWKIFGFFNRQAPKNRVFQAKIGKNDKNRPKFSKNIRFFYNSAENGHKMGTRSGFSMKNSGKCSSERGENTFKQLFSLKTGWGPRKIRILRGRKNILVKFWSFFRIWLPWGRLPFGAQKWPTLARYTPLGVCQTPKSVFTRFSAKN